jgi:hypothetical protein
MQKILEPLSLATNAWSEGTTMWAMGIFSSRFLFATFSIEIWDVSYLTVDQGDVQYFIGVQLDGTERVRDAAAKDGAILVCIYFTED